MIAGTVIGCELITHNYGNVILMCTHKESISPLALQKFYRSHTSYTGAAVLIQRGMQTFLQICVTLSQFIVCAFSMSVWLKIFKSFSGSCGKCLQLTDSVFCPRARKVSSEIFTNFNSHSFYEIKFEFRALDL